MSPMVGINVTGAIPVTLVTAPAAPSYDLGSTVTLTATPTAISGVSIVLVAFYDGPVLINFASVDPYSTNWASATGGVHDLKVIVYYSNGETSTSALLPVTINDTVAAPASITVPAISTTGNYVVSWEASTTVGAMYVLEESTTATFDLGTVSEVLDRTTPTSATITGKATGYMYYYRVKASKSPMTESGWVSGANGVKVTMNVALAANGGVASASSSVGAGFPAGAINNGDRTGSVWGSGGGWADGTANVYPDWVRINFATASVIDEINVVTLQDNTAALVEPTAGMTFTKYGITNFEVQYLSGATWVTLTNGSITNNNQVMRNITFPAVLTSSIRVLVSGSLGGYSRVVEVEAFTAGTAPTVALTSPTNGQVFVDPVSINLVANAAASGALTVDRVEFYDGAALLGSDNAAPYELPWNTPSFGVHTLTAVVYDSLGISSTSSPVVIDVQSSVVKTNVALATNGGIASASSSVGAGFPAGAINNGDRTGSVWGSGGGWADGTANVYPDWVRINFATASVIDEINVVTLQDNTAALVEPTAGMTFTKYGITNFEVQYLSGATWVTLTNGSITNNNQVMRNITFPAVLTSSIRVLVSGSLGGYSRVVEVEAFTAGTAPTVALTSPTNGQVFVDPVSINLVANAAASGALTVDRVEFYDGAALLGSDNAAPYELPWNTPSFGVHTLTAVVYDSLGISSTSSPVVIDVQSSVVKTNVALATNGGIASASSSVGAGFPAGAINNGDRTGSVWGSGGGWADGTANVYPDWVRINFATASVIDEINVVTLQDNTAALVEPTAGMTFTKYGITNFEVQYLSGATWVTVTNGNITNNNQVMRNITFPAVSTSSIRVLVSGSLAGYSRIVEVEAFAP